MKVEPDPNNTADRTDIDTAEPTAKWFKTGDTTSKSTQSYVEDDGQCSPPATSDLSVVSPVAATNSSSLLRLTRVEANVDSLDKGVARFPRRASSKNKVQGRPEGLPQAT